MISANFVTFDLILITFETSSAYSCVSSFPPHLISYNVYLSLMGIALSAFCIILFNYHKLRGYVLLYIYSTVK